MALERLNADEVYRFRLYFGAACSDPLNPTTTELNTNKDNSNASGLIINPTCAINVDGSSFDLNDPEYDDSITFCQRAGDQTATSQSATVVFEFLEAKERWLDATSTDAVDGYNTATLLKSWLMWQGEFDMYALMSIGKAGQADFAVGDKVKISKVAPGYAIPSIASGDMKAWTQNFASRGSLSWNYELVA